MIQCLRFYFIASKLSLHPQHETKNTEIPQKKICCHNEKLSLDNQKKKLSVNIQVISLQKKGGRWQIMCLKDPSMAMKQGNPKLRIPRLKLPKAQKSGAVYIFAEQQPDSRMTFENETSS